MLLKYFKSQILLVFLLSLFFINQSIAQQGHLQIRNDEFIQIGYDNYKTLAFGIGGNASLGLPNNGQWAMEHWNGGFNIWRPWPQSSWGNYKLFIKDWDGFVGIGKYPVHKLDVNGDIGTFGTLRITSDSRLKTNITVLNGASCLTSLMRVKSVSYNYKYDNFPYQGPNPEGELTEIKQKTIQSSEDNGEVQSKILRHGFLAQDLKEVFPDLVSQDESGFYSIDYIGMIPIMLEAMKEQQTQIAQLKEKIAQLEATNEKE